MISPPPLIAHVIHQLSIGGLENGLINLINRIPETRYRHVIICMAGYSSFKERIQRSDVEVIAINKKPGHDLSAQWRLYKLFRSLRPTMVHSRNLSGLDALLPAFLAGVKTRIHGEHGRDIDDIDGNNRKQQILRRLHSPLISHYITLSQDLQYYLEKVIGIDSERITQIYNGVDTDKFKPAIESRPAHYAREGFANDQSVIMGTVGRFQSVKDQINLAEGFILLLNQSPELQQIARLVMIGDGPLLEPVLKRITEAGYEDLIWLPGARNDIANILPHFDLFVLPSLAEGISNTLLEAMSSGLPVIATAVGGNPEIVVNGKTGTIIPASDPDALACSLRDYINCRQTRIDHGSAGRERVEAQFSINTMVKRYLQLYDHILE